MDALNSVYPHQKYSIMHASIDVCISQLRIRRPPPSPQLYSHFYGRCAQCSIKWKINFPNFIFWVIVDYVHNLQVFFFTLITVKKFFKKKFLQNCSNLHERFALSWSDRKINFPIFRFWVMVDFVLKIHRTLADFECKIDHISKTKSRKNLFVHCS